MSTNPYIITPNEVGSAQASELINYIKKYIDTLQHQLLVSGAILFRGFDVPESTTFESISKSFDSDLKNDYLGTSPRNIVKGTDYVFSASELPPHYPIMQHCEMSFLPTAPRRLMFYCYIQPEIGGETPICDFRAVAKSMNPKIKQEFEKKGIKVIRNYCAPGHEKSNSFQLKPWVDMFQTKDKAIVEKKCAANDITVEWLENDALRLISTHTAFKNHPESGDEAWFNHLQVFHASAAAMEYSKIAQRQKSFDAWKVNLYLQAVTFAKRFTEKPVDRAMHVCYADGSEIPESHIQHVQDLIWENMYFLKWQKGDVIIIDNFSTSHGRMPYQGPREIQVSWTS